MNTNDEHFHIEWAQGIHEDENDEESPVTHFANMVDVAYSRSGLRAKLLRLAGDPDVMAVHVRSLGPYLLGAEVYGESQPLAVAQARAHQFQVTSDKVVTAYRELKESYQALVRAGYKQEREGGIAIKALNAVIDSLAGQLRMIEDRAKRADRDAYLLEPRDLLLDAKVNLKALRESELRKAQLKSRTHVGEKPWIGDEAGEPEPDLQGEIEQLRSQLSEARSQAGHAIGREGWYANAVDRLRDKFGKDAVDPIVRAARLAHDFNRLTPEGQEKAQEDGYVPESAPEGAEPMEPENGPQEGAQRLNAIVPQIPGDGEDETPLCTKCGKDRAAHGGWAMGHVHSATQAKLDGAFRSAMAAYSEGREHPAKGICLHYYFPPVED